MQNAVPLKELEQIPALHDEANLSWHNEPAKASPDLPSFLQLVRQQHRANFDLWHEEDAARDPRAQDSAIARVKRAIDTLNQRRNDLAEALDTLLFGLAGVQNADAPLHSESPGLIIDRLSILSLKIFHTEEQIQRNDVEESHRVRNRQRLAVLQRQRQDLAFCLAVLWNEVVAGQRQFRLYRQLKMYNDPDLNPVLYRAGRGH